MITNTEVIVQDQLITSAAAGKVRVHYPRGSSTVLTIDDRGTISLQADTNDGAWQQAEVLPNGNLKFISDQPASIGNIIMGANLKAL
jgi:hypothetical protein